MPAQNAADRQVIAQIAAHTSWANTENRSARTAPARHALEQKFLDAAAGDPVRAEHLRLAHYKRLALKSVQSRRRAAGLLTEADAADEELKTVGGAA